MIWTEPSRLFLTVPVIRNGEVIAVLDVDSEEADQFDKTDQLFLEQIIQQIKF